MIWTAIFCTHFVSMNLENMSSLQKWPVLDAVSHDSVTTSDGMTLMLCSEE